MVKTKRVYDPVSAGDGKRILIDRLWPRGVSRESARLFQWRKDLAPSDELRRSFGHDPRRFPVFRARYRKELMRKADAVATLVMEAESGTVTLVYAAKDPKYCNATVLKELLEECLD
jgi:uncharacterized protein YeaO (DUF488 family)